MSKVENIKCLIIGSGPAGLTAAIYAARANLNPVLYEGIEPGGQLTTTTDVENFPGYPDPISGPELMENIKKQALRFDVDIRYGIVTEVDFSTNPKRVIIDGEHKIDAESVIIATGATARYLGLESESRYRGMGVSACATCDGFFYKGQDVAVVGGGDSACEAALYLSNICKKVYMIIRRDVFRASNVLEERVRETENIEILFKHQTKEVLGDDAGVNAMVLNKELEDGSIEEIEYPIDGFFLSIGHNPNTEVFKEYLELDKDRFIVTKPHSSKTNVEGVFAAGDVQDPTYRQAITAAGSGCKAALDCEFYLMTK